MKIVHFACITKRVLYRNISQAADWHNIISLTLTLSSILEEYSRLLKFSFQDHPRDPKKLNSPLVFLFNSYLKKEPLVGLTKHATDASFEETNGLGTRKGGISNEQRLRDLPQIGQVSGKREKNIFH